MRRPGDFEPENAIARRALLDALEALDDQLDAVTWERKPSIRDPASPGSRLAARGVDGIDDPEVVAASCVVLTEELLRTVGRNESGSRKR